MWHVVNPLSSLSCVVSDVTLAHVKVSTLLILRIGVLRCRLFSPKFRRSPGWRLRRRQQARVAGRHLLRLRPTGGLRHRGRQGQEEVHRLEQPEAARTRQQGRQQAGQPALPALGVCQGGRDSPGKGRGRQRQQDVSPWLATTAAAAADGLVVLRLLFLSRYSVGYESSVPTAAATAALVFVDRRL